MNFHCDQRRGFQVLLCLAVMAGIGSNAEPFALQSQVIGGGGGTSTGGPFTLSATLAQPEASSSSLIGESFVIQGGFWNVSAAVVIPDGPTLRIEMLDSQVRISWSPSTPGFRLHESDAVHASRWAPVDGGDQSPVLLSVGEGERFFRLIRE